MNLRHAITVLTTWSLPFLGTGQVRVDKPILLVGDAESDRQIIGLPLSTDPQDVLTAGVEQSGILRTALGSAGNLWSVDLPAFGATPVIGSHVVVDVPATSTGTVSILLNGIGPFQVLRGSDPVDGTSLTAGTMLSLVFDGLGFQVLNGRNEARRDCPGGMVAVNDQFCIESSERGSDDFFGAAVTCATSGRRMCSWAEFHAACLRTEALGLVGMINSWEWTNNTSNEDNSVRIAGLNDCVSAANWLATGSADQGFRCCLTR